MSTDLRIAESFSLPSKGAIYEENVNPHIIMKSMTTRQEMARLSATSSYNKIMSNIIDECIEENTLGMSSYDLCLGDYQYLMYKLRIVTYGNEYEQRGRCPFCGKIEDININLDDLLVKEYDEGLGELLILDLPVSGYQLELTLQTPRMLDIIDDKNRQYQKRHPNEDGTLLFTLATSIVRLDGEVPDPFTLEEKLKDLPMKDTSLLIDRLNKLNSYIGLDLSIDHKCSKCGEYFISPFQFNKTFFRPDNR